MSDYKHLYTEASIRVREKMSSKLTKTLAKNQRDEGREFVKLTETIPNWQTYLTDKQMEVAPLYLKVLSTSEVDHQLKLTEGVSYHRLFGSPTKGNNERGALGALRKAKNSLEKIRKEKKAASK